MSRRSTQVDSAVPNLIAGAALIVVLAVLVGLWSTALDEPLPPCTPTSTSVCAGDPAEHTPDGARKDSLPSCPTEDSPGCVWDASEQGNGEGHDVVNPPTETP